MFAGIKDYTLLVGGNIKKMLFAKKNEIDVVKDKVKEIEIEISLIDNLLLTESEINKVILERLKSRLSKIVESYNHLISLANDNEN